MKRQFKEKQRGTKTRKRKRLVLFAAEGHNKTERNYIKGLKQDFPDFEFRMARDSSTDPLGMVRSLIKEKKELGFSDESGDLAFCFIDADCCKEKDAQIAEAEKEAKKNGIMIIFSNPCIELWYLCHFTANPKDFHTSQKMKSELAKFISGYTESRDDIYRMLKPRINDAINNAKSLEERCLNRGYRMHTADFSPSTEVYKFIELIMKQLLDPALY